MLARGSMKKRKTGRSVTVMYLPIACRIKKKQSRYQYCTCHCDWVRLTPPPHLFIMMSSHPPLPSPPPLSNAVNILHPPLQCPPSRRMVPSFSPQNLFNTQLYQYNCVTGELPKRKCNLYESASWWQFVTKKLELLSKFSAFLWLFTSVIE